WPRGAAMDNTGDFHPLRSHASGWAASAMVSGMESDAWAPLADRFGDGAYATVKGRVRTRVLHRQLSQHLPPPPATVLDVGGGAGHQSIPLAHAGYDVTILDASAAMLAKARRRLAAEPEPVRRRVR